MSHPSRFRSFQGAPVVSMLKAMPIAVRQGGAIHRRQLRAAGVSSKVLARMVDAGELVAIEKRVFIAAGAPPTWAQRAWIGLLGSPPGSVISHRTAARLHRIGRFSDHSIDILEVEPEVHRGARGTIHRTTYLPPQHRAVVEGFPVTSLARTVFDLAGQVSAARRRRGLSNLTRPQVERALDDALMRHMTIAQLNHVLATLGGRGRGGTTLMRELVEDRHGGYTPTESELEDLVCSVLASHGIEQPVRQVNLGGLESLVGRVDFYFLDARVVLEADGRMHHTALMDAEADRWRDLELAARGFVVIRVTWRQLVHDAQRFVRALRQLLESRQADPAR